MPTGVGRRPGRPPQTDAEARIAREHILTATSEVFAEYGSHGTNVARIIRSASIARPTFYRYFKNTDEALDIVLGRIGIAITSAIETAVAGADGDLPTLVAGIDAYQRWAHDHRALLRSLYVGAHDPNSRVHRLRPILLRQLIELVDRELAAGGRPVPDDWTVDLFLNSMEYACYRLYQPEDRPEPALSAARATMIRTALALLGRAADWQALLDNPEGTQLFAAG